MTNIWCIKCDEAVTHDGKNWIACHCYGCNESEESQYPEQWVVSKELPTRAELLARITALETAGREVVRRRDVGDLLKAIDALAALLGETK